MMMRGGGPLRLTVATAGAAVRAGISTLSMFSSAAINGIQTLLEDNHKKIAPPLGNICKCQSFATECRLCKLGESTIEWMSSPLFDPVVTKPSSLAGPVKCASTWARASKAVPSPREAYQNLSEEEMNNHNARIGGTQGIVKMQEEAFDTHEDKAEEFGDEEEEFGEEEAADFKEFEDFQEEDSDDSEDSEDSDDDERLEAFGRPSGLTIPSPSRQEATIQIEAPVAEIYEILESRGFITKRKKRPTPNDSVLGHEDHHIVAWYHKVSIGLLEFYAWCDNYQKVKAIVNYHLRWSLIHTLSKKHKSSSSQIIKQYGKNLVVNHDGKQLAGFLSIAEIKAFGKKSVTNSPIRPELLIDLLFTKMRRDRLPKGARLRN